MPHRIAFRRLFSQNESPTTWLPQNLVSSPGTLRCDFESLTGWTCTYGSQALDTTNYHTGAAGIQLTSRSGATGMNQLDLGSNAANQWDFSASNPFRYWVYVTDASVTAGVKMQFLDPTGTKSASHNAYFRTGWNQVTILKSEFGLSGGFSWDEKVRYLRLTVTPLSGVVTITYDSFYSAPIMQPLICIAFDDTLPETYTNAFLRAMQPHNIPGTFFVETEHIDGGSSISSAQLLSLQSAGWTIGNHTRSHTDLATADYAGALAAIDNGEADLEAIGITNNPHHLAYPGGAYDADTIQASIDAGMLTGRLATATALEIKHQNYLPFTHPYQIPLIHQTTEPNTVATLTAKVDEVIAAKKIGIFLFHAIFDSGVTGYGWYTDRFIDFCEYIGSKRLPCVNFHQLYQLQSGMVKAKVAQ